MNQQTMNVKRMVLFLGVLSCLIFVPINSARADECSDAMNDYVKAVKDYVKIYKIGMNKLVAANIKGAKAGIKKYDNRKSIKKKKGNKTGDVTQMMNAMSDVVYNETVNGSINMDDKISRNLYTKVRQAKNDLRKALKAGVCKK